MLFILPRPALPTLHIVRRRLAFRPTLVAAQPFPETSHISQDSEQPPESPQEQRSRGALREPRARQRGSSLPAPPPHRLLFPAITSITSQTAQARHPRETQNKGPAHVRNSILGPCADCKTIGALTPTGISLVVKKCLEEKCCADVSADTRCSSMNGFRAAAFCMGHPLFTPELQEPAPDSCCLNPGGLG